MCIHHETTSRKGRRRDFKCSAHHLSDGFAAHLSGKQSHALKQDNASYSRQGVACRAMLCGQNIVPFRNSCTRASKSQQIAAKPMGTQGLNAGLCVMGKHMGNGQITICLCPKASNFFSTF